MSLSLAACHSCLSSWFAGDGVLDADELGQRAKDKFLAAHEAEAAEEASLYLRLTTCLSR